jgi:hypothetical protein
VSEHEHSEPEPDERRDEPVEMDEAADVAEPDLEEDDTAPDRSTVQELRRKIVKSERFSPV